MEVETKVDEPTGLRPLVDFPYFEHLHYYDRVREVRLNISYSNVQQFTFGEFGRELPKDLDLNWTNTNGPEALRKMIAGRHGTHADRVLMTTGATEGNFLVNASLVRPGDRVLVDSPTYSPLRDVPTGFGAEVIEIPRSCNDGWRLDLDRWREEAKRGARLLVFANLSNPTSTALSKSEMQELTDIAEDCGGHVLVDETFRELAFDKTPPSAATFGPTMIALSTVTKVCGLGTLRSGWIVADADLLERFGRLKDYTSGGNSALGQLLAGWALERWDFFLDRAKRILTRNRTIVREALAGMPALRGNVPPWGTVLFPHSTVDVPVLAETLQKKFKTVIAQGRFFGLDDHFRLGLGGDTDELQLGLENLRKALRSAQ